MKEFLLPDSLYARVLALQRKSGAETPDHVLLEALSFWEAVVGEAIKREIPRVVVEDTAGSVVHSQHIICLPPRFGDSSEAILLHACGPPDPD